MRRFQKLILLFFIAMLMAAIPFVVLGESFEEQIKNWFLDDWSAGQRFWLIVWLLAVDIVIPIPSSAVSTYGGAILGFFPATIASWIGMMLGSLAGFLLARLAGPAIVRRMTKVEDLTSLQKLNQRMSLWTIILTRPLPILAEATILLIGSLKLPWSRLIIPLACSNLVIAIGYSAAGSWAVERNVTLYVIVASFFFPLFMTWGIRRQLRRTFLEG